MLCRFFESWYFYPLNGNGFFQKNPLLLNAINEYFSIKKWQTKVHCALKVNSTLLSRGCVDISYSATVYTMGWNKFFLPLHCSTFFKWIFHKYLVIAQEHQNALSEGFILLYILQSAVLWALKRVKRTIGK